MKQDLFWAVWIARVRIADWSLLLEQDLPGIPGRPSVNARAKEDPGNARAAANA